MSKTSKQQNTPPSKSGKPGAPRKNRNAIRHGLRAGQLPKDAKYIEVRLNTLRRNLEDAVLHCKGKVSIADAGLIQTAIRWERHAALAQRWLTKQYAKLKPMEQLRFSNEIATASAKRDSAIESLELDQEQSTIIEALYAVKTITGDQQ